jgi:hypothetical protein
MLLTEKNGESCGALDCLTSYPHPCKKCGRYGGYRDFVIILKCYINKNGHVTKCYPHPGDGWEEISGERYIIEMALRVLTSGHESELQNIDKELHYYLNEEDYSTFSIRWSDFMEKVKVR